MFDHYGQGLLIHFQFVSEIYFVAQRTKQLCMQQMRLCMHVVVYEIHEHIASSQPHLSQTP